MSKRIKSSLLGTLAQNGNGSCSHLQSHGGSFLKYKRVRFMFASSRQMTGLAPAFQNGQNNMLF